MKRQKTRTEECLLLGIYEFLLRNYKKLDKNNKNHLIFRG